MHTMYNVDLQDLTVTANLVKDLVVDKLKSDGMLTEGQSEEVRSSYIVLVRTKGLFGRWYGKARGEPDDNAVSYSVLRTS